MKTGILFDLDGTLINSIEDLADSGNFALSEMGYPVHPTDAYKIFVGNGIPKLIERALPSDVDKETFDSPILGTQVARH